MATRRSTSLPKRTKWTLGPHCWSTAPTPTRWHGKASAPFTWQRRRAAWTWCHCCWPRTRTSTCAIRCGRKQISLFIPISLAGSGLLPQRMYLCVDACLCVSFPYIQSGLTPLHLAAQEDKVNVAEVLLNHGADVNPATKVKLSQTHTHTL